MGGGCLLSPSRPNVWVIFSLDSARFDYFPVSCGGSVPDHYLKHFAQFCREARVYTRAYAPGPTTWFSIASLYTGVGVPQHRIGFHNNIVLFSPAFVRLPQLFQARSWHTLLITGNVLLLHPASGFASGFEKTHPPIRLYKKLSYTGWNPVQLVHKASELMKNSCPPCFVHIHLAQPHWPYGAPIPYIRKAQSLTRCTVKINELKRQSDGWYHLPFPLIHMLRTQKITLKDLSPEKLCTLRTLYMSGLMWADQAFGNFLNVISREKYHALVFLTSDHGEALGEFGQWEHGGSLIEHEVHVPLALSGASIPEGVDFRLVTLQDIFNYARTFLRLRYPDHGDSFSGSFDFQNNKERKWLLVSNARATALYFRDLKIVLTHRRKTLSIYRIQGMHERPVTAFEYPYIESALKFIKTYEYGPIVPPDVSFLKLNFPEIESSEWLRQLGYAQVHIGKPDIFYHLQPHLLRKKDVSVQVKFYKKASTVEVRVLNTGTTLLFQDRGPQVKGGFLIRCEQNKKKKSVEFPFPTSLYPGERLSFRLPEGFQPTVCTLIQRGGPTWPFPASNRDFLWTD